MKWFINYLISSLGLKRKLSALFAVLSKLIATVPDLAPFAPLLESIAAFFGITGVVHAGKKGTLTDAPLATIAAFFNALKLVAESVPALAPYVYIINAVAMVFNTLALGSATMKSVNKK